MKAKRNSKRGQRGFSLMEAVIAAAVLGIGLVGLAQLHIASLRGTVKAQELSRASQVAAEIADHYATLDFQAVRALPAACGAMAAPPVWATNPPTPGAGCKASFNTDETNMNPPVAGCSAWLDEDGVADAGNAAWVADPIAGAPPPGPDRDFMVRLRRSAHPNPVAYPADPDPNNRAVAVLWVWVCWFDENGFVHEIATTRIVPENM